MRSQRRILWAGFLGGLLSGAPSVICAARAERSVRGTVRYALEATRAIGTLSPSGRPGLVRGGLLHGAISLGLAEALAAVLPRRHPVLSGAFGGLLIGGVNLGWIARRRYPAIAALPLAPQLADNAAFGAIVGWVLRAPRDDPGRVDGRMAR